MITKMMPLPTILPVSEIHERLQVIFPERTPNRNYVTREIAADGVAGSGTEAGFREEQVAFVTAYADHDNTAFKGSVSELAWKSFAWFGSEPEHIIMLHRGANVEQAHLSDLMRS